MLPENIHCWLVTPCCLAMGNAVEKLSSPVTRMNAYHLNHPPPSSKMTTFWAVVNFGDCEHVYFLQDDNPISCLICNKVQVGGHIISHNSASSQRLSYQKPSLNALAMDHMDHAQHQCKKNTHKNI